MCVCLSLNAYVYTDGETTTQHPPEYPRPELWITVSLLLVIVIASACGLFLYLRFQRTRSTLKNAEDNDVTMLKVPNGEDPTYGVRDARCQGIINRFGISEVSHGEYLSTGYL